MKVVELDHIISRFFYRWKEKTYPMFDDSYFCVNKQVKNGDDVYTFELKHNPENLQGLRLVSNIGNDGIRYVTQYKLLPKLQSA